MKNKFIALAITASMLLSVTPAFAASDTPSDWAQSIVSEAIADGIVPARLQSDYQAPIKRGEFAELLVQTIFTRVKKENTNPRTGEQLAPYWTQAEFNKFVTVDSNFEDADQDYIKQAFALGAINGVSDNQFAPNNLITRQEAATMLANTVHMVVGFTYKDADQIGFSDYSEIADWAKPAVQVVKLASLMDGTGEAFDYNGNFTREQSIVTMLRLFERINYGNIMLRGNIVANPSYDQFFYNVGKNHVYVTYKKTSDGEYNTALRRSMYSLWNSTLITKNYPEKFNIVRASEIYLFGQAGTKFQGIVDAALNDKAVKVDFGFMTYETKKNGHIAEFVFKNVAGYATVPGGYRYGFPQVPVEPKVIN